MATQYKDQSYLDKVGKRIIKIRDDRGLSQEQLAETSGLDTRQIGRIERAETNSSISLIKKIADSLGIKVSDILDV